MAEAFKEKHLFDMARKSLFTFSQARKGIQRKYESTTAI